MSVADSTLTVKSDLESLSKIRRFVESLAVDVGLTDESASELRLAVDEACANIIMHGYKEDGGDISISAEVESSAVRVVLSDRAPPFNPLAESKAPSLDLPLEERPIGGMGVMLIKQNVDEVVYRQGANGENILVLSKYLK